jgi:nitroreductase
MPMQEIINRRSIRSYKSDAVSEEQIEQVLRAAMAAPSAGNQQPWEFIVVTDRTLLTKITEIHPYSKMLLEAPAAVIVCGDTSREKHAGYWVQDCSAAVENILLEATHLGLGSVWLGVHPLQERAEGLKQLFKMPKSVIPLAVIALGYAKEQPAPVDRFNPNYIHRNAW